MKSVEYHPNALDELIQSAEYFETRSEGLGGRFLDEVGHAVADVLYRSEEHDDTRSFVRKFVVHKNSAKLFISHKLLTAVIHEIPFDC